MIGLAGARFLLNAEAVACEVPPGLPLLDLLRGRGLCGTKDGCREGECGACMVMLGARTDRGIAYESVAACLVPAGEVDGKHVVTIEGLSLGDELSPVQRAIVAEGATQCGFCTPGIVVSVTHYLATQRGASDARRLRAVLGGHLCRCTGYASLLRAGARLDALPEAGDTGRNEVLSEARLARLAEHGVLPDYFREIPARLHGLAGESPPAPESPVAEGAALRIAGGTDVYVEQGEEVVEAPVELLHRESRLAEIRRSADRLEIGGLVSFQQLAIDPEFRRLVPEIDRLLSTIASPQIRARATLAGNVVNASPIGDLTILLLALDACVHLRGTRADRTLPLRRLYLGYKSLDLAPSELLTHISVPLYTGDTRVSFEKVAKRTHLDIASVNSALRIDYRGERVVGASLALGGVAPVPKLLERSSAFLVGKRVSEATVRELLPLVQEEITPIGDVRGGSLYKRLIAKHLVVAHFARLFPESVRPEAFL
jgi:xanthine dehydrogenase small subunit